MIDRAMVLVLVLSASPLAAQQLNPQLASPLLAMIQAAQIRCQAGDRAACLQAQQMQQAGGQLAQAQFACQQGNPQACQAYQQGAQQVFTAYQQHVGAYSGPQLQAPPPTHAPAGSYSQDQMTWEHQQRMREIERNGRIQQNNAAAASAQRDREHQRFMEQLRR